MSGKTSDQPLFFNKNTIMQPLIQDFLRDHLLVHIVLIALSVLAMLLAMFVDLLCGLRKAKQRGELTTSTGLKKTATKAMKYLVPYLVLVLMDVLTSIFIPVPAFSMFWALYCVFCEFKSVREKAWQKAEIERQEKTFHTVLENKEDVLKLLDELLLKVNNSNH